MGDRFLAIVESKAAGPDHFDRHTIVVFDKDLEDFRRSFEAVARRIERGEYGETQPASDEPMGEDDRRAYRAAVRASMRSPAKHYSNNQGGQGAATEGEAGPRRNFDRPPRRDFEGQRFQGGRFEGNQRRDLETPNRFEGGRRWGQHREESWQRRDAGQRDAGRRYGTFHNEKPNYEEPRADLGNEAADPTGGPVRQAAEGNGREGNRFLDRVKKELSENSED